MGHCFLLSRTAFRREHFLLFLLFSRWVDPATAISERGEEDAERIAFYLTPGFRSV
jgi:hypothetical protein